MAHVFLTFSASSWTVPAGVTTITVELVGGGGTPAYGTAATGGGGGYARADNINVTPGQSISLYLASGAPFTGSDLTWFVSQTYLFATRGASRYWYGGAGGVGGGTAANVTYTGGKGFDQGSGLYYPTGGGAAGPHGNGLDGLQNVGGLPDAGFVGPTWGDASHSCGAGANYNQDGQNYGGGASANGTYSTYGGGGLIVITYTAPITIGRMFSMFPMQRIRA